MSLSIERREFLQRAAAAAAVLGVGTVNSAAKARYPMGLQLYTVREPMAMDALGTLTRVAELGYRNLETYGFDPVAVKYYDRPAAELRKVLDDLGMTTTTGHYDLHTYLAQPPAAMTDYIGRCIEGAHALNQQYITWAWLDPQSRSLESFKLVAERLNLIGAQAAKAGLKVAYHNHDFEFIAHDGKLGYDIIMQETDPDLVKLQLDLYWVAYTGTRTAHELFAKQPGRFVMWHVKDMDKENKRYTELGNGAIDFVPIMADANLAGLENYFVEQGDNFAVSPMKSIEVSAQYVRQHLQ
jgi:sugar phosphate isomerase/epimerase